MDAVVNKVVAIWVKSNSGHVMAIVLTVGCAGCVPAIEGVSAG